ncbi:hypothetical protein E2C01_024094 [Portunus trituberculatus]|uniref:Uncharacterized protein n=1 Tax=Portunus trituberculatus TaxID=210409 RepID=A0A5B7EBT4_PORTR|nr:hypothetical protein [Portunus trituberculatus]
MHWSRLPMRRNPVHNYSEEMENISPPFKQMFLEARSLRVSPELPGKSGPSGSLPKVQDC